MTKDPRAQRRTDAERSSQGWPMMRDAGREDQRLDRDAIRERLLRQR